MNRDGTDAQGIRLDPDPGGENAKAEPDRIQRRGVPETEEAPEPQEEGSLAADATAALDRMEEDQRLAEEDKKFLEDYKDLDLMQLIMQGYVEHDVTIIKGMKVRLRTITEDEDAEISKGLEGLKGSQLWLSEQISRKNLSYGVTAVNGAVFGEDNEDRFARIGKWGKPIKLAIWEEWQKLNKAVGMMIKGGRSGNSLVHRLIGQDLIY